MKTAAVKLVRGHRGDYTLGLIIFILLAFGLIMMYNISPALSQKAGGATTSYFRNQLIYMVAGVFVWGVASNLYYQKWRRLATPLLGFSILALLAVFLPGIGYSALGASRWLHVGPLSFQPAELLKISIVLYLAAWFESHQEEIKSFKDGVLPFIGLLVISGVIIAIKQRDLGTMLVIALSSLGMLYVAGVRLRHLMAVLAGGAGLGVLLIMAFPHRMSRFLTFLDPTRDATGQGYHINQALIGIGSGGLLGTGLGRSIQTYGYLPESQTDSIFAVIGEEFGLIGALIVIGLFGLLIYRGFQIAKNAPDSFGRLTAAGITLIFLFQAFVNIAAMLSLVPLTGIPLPFVSYGGSSLLIMMGAAGILFNISKYSRKEEAHEDSRQRRGNGRPRFTGTSDRRRVTAAR